MKIIRTICKIVLIVCICLSLLFAVKYILEYYQDRLVSLTEITSPYLHNGDGKILSVVHRGKEYFVRVITKRLQPCDIVVTYYFEQVIDDDDTPRRILWYPYPVYLARAVIGSSIADRFIVIPIYMKPGGYFLVRQAQYTCGGQTFKKDFSIPITIAK
jgi:hypothetical protein